MKIKEIWETLSEIIFPSSLVERRVRKMGFEDFDSIKEIRFDTENNVLSFFKYQNPLVRETIKQIKYKRGKELARIIALIIYSELLEELSDLNLFENFNNPVLVPVPMSMSEKRERGYNQVEILIDEIVKASGGNLHSDFNLLQKTKSTSRQTELKREERLRNVKGAFKVSPRARGKNIILVDDVMTTGATINEARHVLEQAGVRNVFVVVAGR